eukprot:COSAG05_NODE_885_length_6763_cov_10.115396_12_plen_99_part_00
MVNRLHEKTTGICIQGHAYRPHTHAYGQSDKVQKAGGAQTSRARHRMAHRQQGGLNPVIQLNRLPRATCTGIGIPVLQAIEILPVYRYIYGEVSRIYR